MASTTGAPERPPNDVPETEPLLGRPGDAAQVSGGSYGKNLVLGMSLTPSPSPHGILSHRYAHLEGLT